MRVISLFSGCGGFDLGVERRGHTVVWANDNFGPAAKTYRANFPHVKFVHDDIREIRQFPSADMVVGCYPCQGYSEGGARNGDEDRNYLYREFARCLRLVQPKYFVAENVGGMYKLFNGRFLQNQIAAFRFAGYRIKHKLLDAKDYGIPQERKRIFIVGVRTDIHFEYEFPKPSHGPGRKYPYKTLRGAIGDMPLWPPGDEYWREAFHWYYLSRNRRRGWNEYSLCILANRRHIPLHPMSKPLKRIGPDCWKLDARSRYRRLSYKECAAIQTFPKSFKIPADIGLESKYLLIGNAVPPRLAEVVVRGFDFTPVGERRSW